MDVPTGRQLQRWWTRVPEPLRDALMTADPDYPVPANLVAAVRATQPMLEFAHPTSEDDYRLPLRTWQFVEANRLLLAYETADAAWHAGPPGPELLAARDAARKAYHEGVYGLVDRD